MGRKWDDDENSNKNPKADHDDNERSIAQLLTQGHKVEGMEGDGEHEDSTCWISNLEPQSLEEAGCCPSFYFVFRIPFCTDQKRDRLLDIRNDQVVNENNILIVTDIPLVVAAPEDESVGNKRDQDEGGNGGENGHDEDSDQAFTVVVGEGVDREFPCIIFRIGQPR